MLPRRSVRVGRGRGRGRAAMNAAQPEPPQGWEERFARMEETIQRQNAEINQLRQQAGPPVRSEAPMVSQPPAIVGLPVAENRMEPLFERFRKQHPPVFEGSIDPVQAEEWISGMERILNMMGVQGNERVVCASFMLRKDARIWWEVVEQSRDVNTMDWDGFKQVFNDKYYNSAVLAAKMDEFTKLTQGNLSVTEYAQKFDRLAKFAKDLVPTDKVRADRFVRGLKPMIARDVEIVSRGAFTYAEVVEMALTAERSEERIWKDNVARRDAKKSGATTSTDNRKRVQDQPSQARNDKRPKPNNDNRPGGNGSRNIPPCPKCTKRHLGECRAGVCYKCGKEGHVKRNCPTWEQSGSKEEQKKDDKYVPARVFTITQAEAEASPSVITGASGHRGDAASGSRHVSGKRTV
ncbi:uncharacterized protein LOC133831715 isoform X1 [Humulus lupulus]|uniref:uncharacterized protein LOC133819744 n=1 Tax=Humulus lupulus TaxID=3486 RepID=UPI002B40CD03|nr:uncharacterized protein LOC133781434 isoform X1 [Humulus lupulus]XP_062076390.1 uncharacterized protein LOC133781434 isoform X2 [Humulus lupulus]XP_062076391.1 uncharacterized protein LOC133781434 isoform X1 [Humulus lupulus]XP_062076393.1 uncharacterized protein LOC133781434 isoform X2 [Humulus lupulus]XP_062076394.1 uncharacterized protein LOC133781434 isoform X2 [Humulus lupulus]XP_062076673.1 uncharacterized protein LOC133781636 isoform X1 [Humulus lupulus]XP_062076674.1 uncharacterize